MNKSDYDKYYQKGGSYVIPTEIFNELLDDYECFKNDCKKYKEVIDKAINNCNNTLNYINNTILKNNIKVELNELLKIKGGLDTILESLVEEVE